MKLSTKWSFGAMAVMGAAVMAACGGAMTRTPMTMSLTDLTGECRYRTENTPMGKVYYEELTSISGQLVMPEVGVLYHHPKSSLTTRDGYSAAYVMGMSDAQGDTSFALTQIIEPPTKEKFAELAAAIENCQSKLMESVRLTLDVARAEEALRRTKESDASISTQRTKVSEMRQRLTTVDQEAAAWDVKVNEALKDCPGVVVARWSKSSEAGGSVEAGNVASASGQFQSGRDGYVLLGGIATTRLYFGHNFTCYVGQMKDGDYQDFRKNVRLPIYLTQARYIRYLSGSQASAMVAAALDVDAADIKKNLTEIDRVKLNLYFAMATRLSNLGSMGDTRLVKTPLEFVKWKPAAFDKPVEDRSVHNKHTELNLESRPDALFEAIAEKPEHKPSWREECANWKTVHAILANAPDVYDALRDSYLKENPCTPYDNKGENAGKGDQSAKVAGR